jgi:uncharacterized protein
MKCPHCTDADLVMSDRQGIEIDYCPKCRGVWLDRGELDKIIERSAAYEPRYDRDDDGDDDDRRRYAQQPTSPPPAYQQPYDQRHYKQHKRKSFWSELFD